jgi:alpha-1,6-mannosyltransferase
VTVALLACYRKAPFVAGVFLALATLVKFLPIVIVPALYRRWDWRLPAALAASVICLYLPYLSVGREVLGFLPAYVSEERLATGSGYFIVSLISFVTGWTLPALVYLAAALLLLAALAVLAMRDAAKGDWVRQLGWCLWLATALLVLATPHYPWYFLWLLPLLCLAPRWPVLILTAGSFVLYAVLENRSGTRELAFNSALYGTFLLATAGQLWVHRRERRPASVEETAGSGR